MAHAKIANNYHDIFMELLDQHYNRYDYCNSPRGLQQREKIFTNYILTNPIERVVLSKERRCNIIFQFAEVLWYLSGDDSLKYIEYYAPRMREFSQDGKVLTGTAYGRKIFYYADSINQWQYVVDELKKDPDSRRCVINIRDPKEILVENNVDMSCTISLQFLLRENKLNMITTMRSNDIYTGGISDIFSFTFFQEMLANQLNVEVGNYYHQVGSSHLYSKNFYKAAKILEKRKEYKDYNLRFPRMPEGNNWTNIRKVLRLEKILREQYLNLCYIDNCKKELPQYWQDVISLFEFYAIYKQKGVFDQTYIEDIHPILKYLVVNFYDV